MTASRYLLLSFLVFCIAACSDSASTKQEPGKIIYVAAEEVPCHGAGPMTCLLVREHADQPWQLHYFGIEGFEFHPGTEYRLRITEIQVDNPPADGSSVRWILKEVLDKRVATHGDGLSTEHFAPSPN